MGGKTSSLQATIAHGGMFRLFPSSSETAKRERARETIPPDPSWVVECCDEVNDDRSHP